MKRCEEVRELIPWYLEGRLGAEESVDVAAHVAGCAECVRDVADAGRVRSAVRDALASVACDEEAMWERASRQAVGRRLARIDVGSFLLGLRLGAWLTRRGTPVRADLRVLGREVSLIDRRKRGGSS